MDTQTQIQTLSKFAITDGKGFQITFPNGVTVSVQFGNGNYCANRYDRYLDSGNVTSPDAKIAIWGQDGKWITRDMPNDPINDDVIGWQSPEQVLEALI